MAAVTTPARSARSDILSAIFNTDLNRQLACVALGVGTSAKER